MLFEWLSWKQYKALLKREVASKLVVQQGGLVQNIVSLIFKKCYISLVLNLQQEAEQRSDAKAVGLSSLVTEHRFV